MERISGLMPDDEVTIKKSYKDKYGAIMKIQAGPNGWTIIWPYPEKYPPTFKDITRDPQENFNEVYDEFIDTMRVLTECDDPCLYEIKE